MEEMFRDASIESVSKRIIVSSVLSVISLVGIVVLMTLSGGRVTMLSVVELTISIAVSYWFYVAAYVGLSFNWKRVLLGLVFPVPMLSYFLEFTKCFFIGFKAMAFVLKKR